MIINQVVSGSGGGSSVSEPYLEYEVDNSGKMIHSKTTNHIINLNGATDLDGFILYYAYRGNTNISGEINWASLTKISGYQCALGCFEGCTGITGVNLSNLQIISGYGAMQSCFNNCTGITSINLSNLIIVNTTSGLNAAFGNTGVSNINLPLLTTVNSAYGMSSCFGGCSLLASVSIPSLKILKNYPMQSTFTSTALTDLKFPALTNSFGGATNIFDNMLRNVTGCTVHFPSNLQSVMSSWTAVTSGFGGTNTTVLFDLPSTAHLTGANSTEYERNPKDDTATALAWRIKDTGTESSPVIDWTSFYTSGTTDPSVSDAIYSDAACTISVTTITAIA